MKDKTGTFTDNRDGKTYKTVEICGKTWLAENLNYKTDEGSWCYGNDEANGDKWGRLYTWNAAMAACPPGWHLPSVEEWNKLLVLADSTFPFKAESEWSERNGSDDYGLSALPAGEYDHTNKTFDGAGMCCSWWTSDESAHSNKAFAARIDDCVYTTESVNNDDGYDDDGYDINEENEDVTMNYQDKGYGYSVRCIKD